MTSMHRLSRLVRLVALAWLAGGLVALALPLLQPGRAPVGWIVAGLLALPWLALVDTGLGSALHPGILVAALGIIVNSALLYAISRLLRFLALRKRPR